MLSVAAAVPCDANGARGRGPARLGEVAAKPCEIRLMQSMLFEASENQRVNMAGGGGGVSGGGVSVSVA